MGDGLPEAGGRKTGYMGRCIKNAPEPITVCKKCGYVVNTQFHEMSDYEVCGEHEDNG